MSKWTNHNPDSLREQEKSDHPGWLATYELLLGEGVQIESIPTDTKEQRDEGIDRFVTTPNGVTLNCQEKDRRNVWDDILLEFKEVHDERPNRKGWVVNPKKANWLLYVMWPDDAFAPMRAYLYDFSRLSRWFNKHSKRLKTALGVKRSDKNNDGYHGLSVPVPFEFLERFEIESPVFPWDTLRHARFNPTGCKCPEDCWEVRGDGKVYCNKCDRFKCYEHAPRAIGIIEKELEIDK